MSEDKATPEQAEVSQAEDRTYGSLEEAMGALDVMDDDGEIDAGNDTTEADQPDPDTETEETDDGLQEDEAEEEVTEDEEEEPGDDEAEDIAPLDYDPSRKVTLEDGTEATLEELVNGNLRQADYTRKTEALAEERREIQAIREQSNARAEEITQTYDGLVEFLQGIIPPEPSLELLGHDQQEYLRQQAIRKSFTDELSTVLQQQTEAKARAAQVDPGEIERIRKAEANKLVEVMPMLSDPMKMDQFTDNVKKTAIDLGFTADEIGSTLDHRLLRLVHLAGIGKRSLENQENARRRIKEKSATPATKKPAASPSPTARQQNKKAMRRLAQTGSIQDAMAIDFE
jgi:hypothetical protein